MCKVKKDYNGIDFSKFVEYSENSPTSLIWKVRLAVNKKIGSVAGSVQPTSVDGERLISSLSINKVQYLTNRVIWTLFHGNLNPDFVVDHIDGDTWNNCISNLRAITPAENIRNSKKRSTNTSGFTGVWRHTVKDNCEYFTSSYSTRESKRKTKSFSISKLGEQKALELALTWRRSMLSSLEDQGIFYSSRHGL